MSPLLNFATFFRSQRFASSYQPTPERFSYRCPAIGLTATPMYPSTGMYEFSTLSVMFGLFVTRLSTLITAKPHVLVTSTPLFPSPLFFFFFRSGAERSPKFRQMVERFYKGSTKVRQKFDRIFTHSLYGAVPLPMSLRMYPSLSFPRLQWLHALTLVIHNHALSSTNARASPRPVCWCTTS